MATHTILVVDDERLIRWSLTSELQRGGYQVNEASDGKTALAMISASAPDLILLDIKLPDIDGLEILQRLRKEYPDIVVIMITAHSIVEFAVKALKFGAYDYICKPFNFDELLIVIRNACDMLRLRRGIHSISSSQARNFSLENIIGKCAKMREIFAMLEKIGYIGNTTMLLQGESGTGKDLLAKTVHYTGERRQYPFVEINCSAIPETLLESELLGFEKGAFTDAKTRKQGLFELADGGTLYLDEIGDMPYPMQAKLLKFIESKSFRRLGGVKDIAVDVRIIAATNQNLEQAIAEKRFRQDLYYRLNVMRIALPSLRERDDVLSLAEHFLTKHALKMRKKTCALSPEVQKIFREYPWPGNIRELQNVIERGVILMEGAELLPAHLPPELQSVARPAAAKSIVLPEQGMVLDDYLIQVERDIIAQALGRFDNNQVRTARFLGISRDALRYRMKKIGINTGCGPQEDPG